MGVYYKLLFNHWISYGNTKKTTMKIQDIWVELIILHQPQFPSFGKYTMLMQIFKIVGTWVKDVQELTVLSLQLLQV